MRKNERFKNLPILETKRLLLRSSDLSDAEDTFEFISDPEVTKYTFWHVHHSIADSEGIACMVDDREFCELVNRAQSG